MTIWLSVFRLKSIYGIYYVVSNTKVKIMNIAPQISINLALILILILLTNQVHESNSQIDSLSPLESLFINSQVIDD